MTAAPSWNASAYGTRPSELRLKSFGMTDSFLPRRIASLQPSATDTMARLGLLDRVVACTRHCADIVEGATEGRTVLSDSWSATAAAIMSTRPDLVIASVPYQAESLAQILKSGVRFLALAPKVLEDIYGDIAAIAGLLGVPERGAHVIADMQRAIDEVRQTAAMSPSRLRVFCEEWGKPVIACEPWVAEMVVVAGGDFIGEAGKRTNPEAVRAVAPEVIVFAWTGAGDRVPAEKAIHARGWQDTPAARAGRIYVIHDALLNTPGPVLVQGVRALASAIHPELFAAAPRMRQLPVI